MNEYASVLLVHNILSPDRMPLFDELGRHVDLEVVICKESTPEREWNVDVENLDIDVTVLDGPKIGPFVFNPNLLAILLEDQYDAYIIGENDMTLPSVAILAIASLLRDTPLIIWSGNKKPEYADLNHPRYNQIRNTTLGYIQSLLYRFGDRFVAYSDITKRYLVDHGVNEGDISVGGQVVPETQLPKPPARLDSDQGDGLVILYLGYLRKNKGVHHLIEAFQRADIGDALLRIAGSGPYAEVLKSRASGDDRIEFLGYVSGKKKASAYVNADLLVHPTLYDNHPRVINEALHYNLPIITTEAAGVTGLLQETGSGKVVEPGNVSALKKSMERIYEDTEFRQKLTTNATAVERTSDLEYGLEPFLEALHAVLELKNAHSVDHIGFE